MAGCSNDPYYYASKGDGINMNAGRVFHRDSPEGQDVVYRAAKYGTAKRVAAALTRAGNWSHKKGIIT